LRNSYDFRYSKGSELSQTVPRKRYETVIIGGNWGGHGYWVRFEAFEEYFTMSCAIHLVPLSSKSIREASQPADGASTMLSEHMAPLVDTINERYQSLSGPNHPRLPRALDGNTKKHAGALYDDIWEKFGEEVLFRRVIEKPGLHAFVNFRGLVLPVRRVAGESGAGRLSPSRVTSAPDCDASLGARVNVLEAQVSDEEASKWVEATVPLLMSIDMGTLNEPRHPPFEPTEYTFSLFGNKRFIYGSGFGAHRDEEPRSENDQKVNEGSPLNYLMLSFHDEWREVGRTVQRLHTLGTLRLAALFDLRRLMSRDQVLSNLELELRKFNNVHTYDTVVQEQKAAFAALPDLVIKINALLKERLLNKYNGGRPFELCSDESVKDLSVKAAGLADYPGDDARFAKSKRWLYERQRAGLKKVVWRLFHKLLDLSNIIHSASSSSEERSEDLELIRQAIRACNIYYSSDDVFPYRSTILYQVRKALTSMDSATNDGGVSYRADRSEYMRQLFESLSKSLRIDEIRGYQTYTEFVQHRMARSFGLLQSIGARFRYTSDLESSYRQRLEASRLRSHQRALQRLQRGAEYGFWMVLSPYYLGHVAEALVITVGEDPKLHKHMVLWFANTTFSPEDVRAIVTAAAFVLALIYVRYLGLHRRLTKESPDDH
jgi:hypothetical protein